MQLTEELVLRTLRKVEDSGPPPGSKQFTEEQYDALLREILGARSKGPVWVFSYGSLIWKPAFEPAATRKAKALGWQRSFCLKLVRFRGTPEQTGLMMQIDKGESCEGLLQQVPHATEWQDLSNLWRREMTNIPPSNLPRWIEVESDGEKLRAIAFTANPESPNYVGKLSVQHIAERLAVACGHWGSGAEYLRQTVIALRQAGIDDPYLWDLQERVAGEIAKHHGLKA